MYTIEIIRGMFYVLRKITPGISFDVQTPSHLAAISRRRRAKVSTEGLRSWRHRRLQVARTREEAAPDRRRDAERHAAKALCAGLLGAAADLPSHGRGRQGQHDPARDVRRQPARLSGVLVQGAVRGRARSRLS